VVNVIRILISERKGNIMPRVKFIHETTKTEIAEAKGPDVAVPRVGEQVAMLVSGTSNYFEVTRIVHQMPYLRGRDGDLFISGAAPIVEAYVKLLFAA
jgi:hypothetical protein